MRFETPIAIVGIGGIFPGALTLEGFWEMIAGGKDAAREVPRDRWPFPAESVYDPVTAVADKVNSKRACFITDFELDRSGLALDSKFLDVLDPMFHLGLHAGREALRGARMEGVDAGRVGVVLGNIALPTERSSRMAVDLIGRTFEEGVLGSSASVPAVGRPSTASGGGSPPNGVWRQHFLAGGLGHTPSPRGSVARSGSSKVAAVNRYVAGLPAGVIAKALGLRGGVSTLDAACASSLYALKLSCDELLAGRADAMLTGGLSRPDCFYTQMGFSQLRAVSPSGVCSPFDARGDGLVVGEGAGLFLLKRLEDALHAGDEIHGLVRGIGLSNDVEGNILAPSSEGQLRAMRRAYKEAGWDPRSVGLVECHATGTPVGDAVEFSSLRTLWGSEGWEKGACVIGSVKSNVGHLLTGAGAAGLMKVLLALRNKTLPATAHFAQAGPRITLDGGPLRVLGKSEEWTAREDGAPRRAAVSGFGFGGINAHVLIEEWVSKELLPKAVRAPVRWLKDKVATPSRPAAPRKKGAQIAVVGMGAHFGKWRNLRQFSERVLGGGVDHAPVAPRWRGAENTAWFKGRGLDKENFDGHYIDSIEAAVGRFRIPPNELKEMLPQQLLMLLVAAEAISDAGWKPEPHLDAGAFIGIGLDLNTTNFHLRWIIGREAPGWAAKIGLRLEGVALDRWIASLRDAAGPALSANRTMGALGGIVASRIAREFRLGGSSFTVQSEESSGLRALEAAVRALQNGDLNAAIVGAVDLAGDIRSVIGAHNGRPFSPSGRARPFDSESDGTVCGEGAAAVVLKRLDDAIRDGDRIYSVIRGVGTASDGGADALVPERRAYAAALQRAYGESGVSPGSVGLIAAHGSAIPAEDQVEAAALSEFFKKGKDLLLGSAKADVGHAGAASGLASFVKASLCLYQEILPPLRGHRKPRLELKAGRLTVEETPRYWLRDRKDGPRRAGVSSMSVDGNCAHVVLESFERDAGNRTPNVDAQRLQPLGARQEALFVAGGETPAAILASLGRLRSLVRRQDGDGIERLARRWYQEGSDKGARACAIVARDSEELLRLIAEAERALAESPETDIDSSRVFYSPAPLGRPSTASGGGRTAFLFPGSGNHFADMGRELSVQWPQILRNQDAENAALRSQYLPELFWSRKDAVRLEARSLIFGQVTLGTLVSDILRHLGVRVDAAVGYSLGESAALFALRAWNDRDAMLRRMEESSLFTMDLAGPCDAARRKWGLPNGIPVDWLIGVLDVPSGRAKRALKSRRRAYLLIVNTPQECVIGGDRTEVESVVRELGGRFFELRGVTTVHCEAVEPVRDAYLKLHLFKTAPQAGVTFYSGCWGTDFPLSPQRAAESIQEGALYGIDYPKVIESAYRDGVRVFLEMGPGASCSRMVGEILKGRPHLASSACSLEEPGVTGILKLLGRLAAHRVPFDLDRLYGDDPIVSVFLEDGEIAPSISIPIGGEPFVIPPRPRSEAPVAPLPTPAPRKIPVTSEDPFLARMRATDAAKARAHETFLRITAGVTETMARTLAYQRPMLRPLSATEPNVFMDRAACLEFAVGKIGKVLGPEFAAIDAHPTRVRLPDEPLMLVDRILSVAGEARSMTSGRVVTEHDVAQGAWYLDGGRIPICIAVEAGQADLFLSGWLGIDFLTNGLAKYRLLDAIVTFHGPLPAPGATIQYDIHIDRFFRQGETHLFKFHFEGTVEGAPLLSMRAGCAGFFTDADLDAGRGIVHTELDLRKIPGKRPSDWEDLVEMSGESFDDDRVSSLRAGDLLGAFGDRFASIGLVSPETIPGSVGRMRLFDRVVRLDPKGGRYGLGLIRTEADIHPDVWFLTCHFVDDKVMPGTLMFECCMHSLRFHLLRMGWVGEKGSVVHEPVPGIGSQLKCRGQVLDTTKKVSYEISIKELGYAQDGTPFALADALMYADEKAIVEILDMSVRLTGLTREGLRAQWRTAPETEVKPALYDDASILAFALGKPSEAFGEPYRIFDQDRVIARLPAPPYKFLDRITAVTGEPWKLKAGGGAQAQYDVPSDAWYFDSNRQEAMPFAVLLEVALQPCGWLAGYLGSALTSDVDLSFRNLGGSARQFLPIGRDIGTLTTQVKLTQVSHSGGMIIQHYSFEMTQGGKVVYEGTTYFGFFSHAALSDQVGIRDAKIYSPTPAEEARGVSFRVSDRAPLPDAKFRMVDFIDLSVADGGPQGLGCLRGIIDVDPEAWFFKAHFYQDPVWPGSLGLESFLQVLKVYASERWSLGTETEFETVTLGQTHEWTYRGQILRTDQRVTVSAVITEVDDEKRFVRADGHLTVDGRIIYGMKGFTLKAR